LHESLGVNGSACQSEFAALRGSFETKETVSTLLTDPTEKKSAGTQNH
jgi:hypothetical protein